MILSLSRPKIVSYFLSFFDFYLKEKPTYIYIKPIYIYTHTHIRDYADT